MSITLNIEPYILEKSRQEWGVTTKIYHKSILYTWTKKYPNKRKKYYNWITIKFRNAW